MDHGQMREGRGGHRMDVGFMSKAGGRQQSPVGDDGGLFGGGSQDTRTSSISPFSLSVLPPDDFQRCALMIFLFSKTCTAGGNFLSV